MVLQFCRVVDHPGFPGKCGSVFVDHGNVIKFRIVAEKPAVGDDAVPEIVPDHGQAGVAVVDLHADVGLFVVVLVPPGVCCLDDRRLLDVINLRKVRQVFQVDRCVADKIDLVF